MSNRKVCRGACARELEATPENFSKDATKLYGVRNVCRTCDAGRRKTAREELAQKFPSLESFDHVVDTQMGGFSDEDQFVELQANEGAMAFGTPMERACAEALLATGSVAEAAVSVGLSPNQFRAHLNELRRRAATRGYAPASDMQAPTPEGFHVKGVSTLYKIDPDTGERHPVGQWVKTKKDDDAGLAAMMDQFFALTEPLRAVADPIPQALVHDDDLLAVYPMGDPHIGMLAWPGETGNKFDLKIAEDNLFAAVDHLVNLAPPARQALIINLGDFYHSDNVAGTTTRGTPVDVDGRWAKVLATGLRIMRRLIDRALEKHAHVRVINEIGNHDSHAAIFLSIALAQFYEREPRVEIDVSPEPFHWYRFGKVLIGVHHGDRTKKGDLLGVMAVDRAKDWGETEHRYWYIGHVHHDTLKELHGVTVESFRTLAGKDAWHHGQGYRAGRDMKLDVLHREFGKINRHIVGVDQLVTRSDG